MRAIVAAATLGCSFAFVPAEPAQDEVQRLLEASAAYLERYERDVRSIVLEEAYVQSVDGEPRKRTLQSDLIVVADAIEGWIELRDVFVVDGKPVRDHTDRIVALLQRPSPNHMVQARRLAEESARFNLNPIRGRFQRTLNVPFTALRFLRRTNQSRSAWRIERQDRAGDQPAAVLHFDERAEPRLIGSKVPLDTSGAFVISTETGAVLRSELRTSGSISANVVVRYSRHDASGLWLPGRMEERYRIRISGFLTDVFGTATYSNFRQFKVDTSISVK